MNCHNVGWLMHWLDALLVSTQLAHQVALLTAFHVVLLLLQFDTGVAGPGRWSGAD
jgi:hypothetical protein